MHKARKTGRLLGALIAAGALTIAVTPVQASANSGHDSSPSYGYGSILNVIISILFDYGNQNHGGSSGSGGGHGSPPPPPGCGGGGGGDGYRNHW